ncbi:alpha/beta hydrolase [Bacillus sp. DTU_2020_1000418_1_SI_GHA_SEK_038]|uniref:alpha/beta hydrolase n=1 Tax=Bacillus sp. DTU_2020_1000418_1_SI_GHA_SEK_038 TaxID=3077585 RepID=UPI0028E3FD74|nr:alpha/beta hydrolase [Bacillus sp. DTU_2020_1000418_1_SI_GHA_SEK_038]WNS74748.1 alpha/beta hydrolase [Bacillus sp. DTU_2020_1000418_1_SI_GHA_SEK_038]
MNTIIYKEGNGYTLKADFHKTDRENAPVVVYIHGGGLLWGTRKELTEEMIQVYTTNGFAVFSIDYRLAPETKLSGILDDVQDALNWIKLEGPKQFSVNGDRIAVIGGSAGGFLALSTGTFTTKPRAIVSFYGYGDIGANWATTPNSFYLQKDRVPKEIADRLVSNGIITEASVQARFLLYLYARQTGHWIQEVTGINPHMNKEEIQKYSPIYNITKDYPPTLFLHGTKDVDVPYEQSVFMRGALVKEGIEAKLITIPNGEHVFDKDFHNPTVQDALTQVVEFLQTHLSE